MLRPLSGAVADYFGIAKVRLLGLYGMHHSVSLARSVLFYLARETSYYTWVQLGRLFERHHSTVLMAHHRVATTLQGDDAASMRRHLYAVMKRLRQALPEAVPLRICPTCNGAGTVQVLDNVEDVELLQ